MITVMVLLCCESVYSVRGVFVFSSMRLFGLLVEQSRPLRLCDARAAMLALAGCTRWRCRRSAIPSVL